MFFDFADELLSHHSILCYPTPVDKCPLMRRNNSINDICQSVCEDIRNNLVIKIIEIDWSKVIEVCWMICFWDKHHKSSIHSSWNSLIFEAFLYKLDSLVFNNKLELPIENPGVLIRSRTFKGVKVPNSILYLSLL